MISHCIQNSAPLKRLKRRKLHITTLQNVKHRSGNNRRESTFEFRSRTILRWRPERTREFTTIRELRANKVRCRRHAATALKAFNVRLIDISYT